MSLMVQTNALHEQDSKEKLQRINKLIKEYASTNVTFLERNRQIVSAINQLGSGAQQESSAGNLNDLLRNLQETIRSEKDLVIQDLKRVSSHKTYEELSDLFDKNPDFAQAKYEIFVLLEHEKLAIHKEAQRFLHPVKCSKSYFDYSKGDELGSVRAVLNDYTKNDSAFNRLIHLHWNRHHAKEIAEIERNIDENRLTSLGVVLQELKK